MVSERETLVAEQGAGVWGNSLGVCVFQESVNFGWGEELLFMDWGKRGESYNGLVCDEPPECVSSVGLVAA